MIKGYQIQKLENGMTVLTFPVNLDKKAKPIAPQAIIGEVEVEDNKIISLRRNTTFINHLTEYMNTSGVKAKDLLTAAKAQKDGFIYVIDKRYKGDQKKVPSEEVIGRYDIEKGKIMKDSFRYNGKHKFINKLGFSMILEEPGLRKSIMALKV